MSGDASTEFLTSSLVNVYVRSGQVAKAEALVTQCEVANTQTLFLYNSMIRLHARNPARALWWFYRLQEFGNRAAVTQKKG
jgi:hypothetical protein